MADPTTEALTAEREALVNALLLQAEQTEHYRAEAIRISELLKKAEAKIERQSNDLDYEVERAVKWEALATSLQEQINSLLIDPDQPD